MKKIDCLILSTGRAASTAIYKYLDDAGDLHLPWNKEPHYWCDIEKYGGVYDLLRQINVIKDEEYWQLYADSKQIIDASVGYFFYLDEVIRRLCDSNQKPKVLFLYREPLSRAGSLFNEIHKKKLTVANNVLDDIEKKTPDSMWWEFYYDNVRYFKNFSMIESYFDDVLAVNYDYFSENQKDVICSILEFLQIDPVGLDKLDWRPINSSKDALVTSRYGCVLKVGKYLPNSIKRFFADKAGNHLLKLQENKSSELSSKLPLSTAQYYKFRKHINYEDILCMKK